MSSIINEIDLTLTRFPPPPETTYNDFLTLKECKKQHDYQVPKTFSRFYYTASLLCPWGKVLHLLQLWVFGSLLSNFFIDDFAARQYKNCVRILKGSYIVKKCSDNKE